MSLVLASLALFGFGIASGLVAGAPQLGAGTAFGTVLGAGGIMYLGGAGAAGAARGLAAAGLGAARSRMSAALGLDEAAESGRHGAFNVMTGRTASVASETADSSSSMPG